MTIEFHASMGVFWMTMAKNDISGNTILWTLLIEQTKEWGFEIENILVGCKYNINSEKEVSHSEKVPC